MPSTRSNVRHGFALIGIVVYALLAMGSSDSDSGESTQSSSDPCTSDWRKCDNNSDLINNYDGMIDAKTDCQLAAEERAKYGEPEWPWVSFGKYKSGEDYVKTGEVLIIEDDAKFENGFGAMRKTTVVCRYDLKRNTVVDLAIQ
jgi:hypothetical protein